MSIKTPTTALLYCPPEPARRVPEPDAYSSSRWLLKARADAARRDILDALHDAEWLAALLRQDWNEMKADAARTFPPNPKKESE